MINLQRILDYMVHLKKFYNMPTDSDLKFCLHLDGSCSIRKSDNKSIAAFDTINDLEIILNRISI